MSTPDETSTNQQFYGMIDKFVQLANENGQTMDSTVVASAMAFAAARFNSFTLARASGNAEEFAARMERGRELLLEQYNKMILDNFAEYHANYDEYCAPQK